MTHHLSDARAIASHFAFLAEGKALSKPIAHAFAISFLLSMGDLSAIALFGSQDFRTLPLYLFQLLGSYQMESAAVVSLTLLIMSVGCFAVIEKLFIAHSSRGREC